MPIIFFYLFFRINRFNVLSMHGGGEEIKKNKKEWKGMGGKFIFFNNFFYYKTATTKH